MIVPPGRQSAPNPPEMPHVGDERSRLLDKLRCYEQFLHDLQAYAAVAMNPDAVRQLIDNACRWSYAHRAGNGERSEAEEDAAVLDATHRLSDVIR